MRWRCFHVATVLEGGYSKWKKEHEQRYYSVAEWICCLPSIVCLTKDDELGGALDDQDAPVTLRLRNTLKLRNVKNVCNFDPQTWRWEICGDNSGRGHMYVNWGSRRYLRELLETDITELRPSGCEGGEKINLGKTSVPQD